MANNITYVMVGLAILVFLCVVSVLCRYVQDMKHEEQENMALPPPVTADCYPASMSRMERLRLRAAICRVESHDSALPDYERHDLASPPPVYDPAHPPQLALPSDATALAGAYVSAVTIPGPHPTLDPSAPSTPTHEAAPTMRNPMENVSGEELHAPPHYDSITTK